MLPKQIARIDADRSGHARKIARILRSSPIKLNRKKLASREQVIFVVAPQDSENDSVFSQALGRAYPILAALCFLKQRVHFLIATPGKGKKKEEKKEDGDCRVPRCLPGRRHRKISSVQRLMSAASRKSRVGQISGTA